MITISTTLSWITWDPPRVLFNIPYFNHPIMWYGACFVFGFILAYIIIVPMVKGVLAQSKLRENDSNSTLRDLSLFFIDKLTWYIVIGTIIGARLGHVFFYDWPLYKNNLWRIPMVWEGGLASHGGTIGVLLAVYFFNRKYKKTYPEFTLIKLMDILAAPVALAAAFIRIGNFFNQEILGLKTDVPWAIIFGHPADGSFPVPRHPAQLYEALDLLIIFSFLYILWRIKNNHYRPGLFIGLFFVLSFGARFVIEFWKEHQSMMIDESVLQTGQILSIPMILLGFILLIFGKKMSESEDHYRSNLKSF